MSFEPNGASNPTQPVRPIPPTTRPAATSADAPTEAWPVWEQPQRQPQPSQSKERGWGLVFLGGCLLALVAVLMLVATAFLLYHSDLIMPGVRTLGVDLGGMSTTQAAALLRQNWQARTVILDAGDTNWSVSPAMLGVMLDAEATAQVAHQQGRSLATLREVLETQGGVSVTPVWQIDPSIAESNLRALAPQLDVPPVNAGLQVMAGRVETTPPVAGRALDVAATVAWLEWNTAQVIAEGKLELVMVPVQPTLADVSVVIDQANQLLASPLSIRAYDPIADLAQAWTVPPDVWGTWLTLGVDPGDSTRLNWEVSAEKAQAFLSAQAATLGPDRTLDMGAAVTAIVDAIRTQRWDMRLRIGYRERQHVVQPGETLSSIARDYGMPYPWIQQANPEAGDALYAGQVLTIPSPDVLLPLPVVENKRIVVSLGQQRMWVYEYGGLKWEWPVSTGIESSPTSPGVFQIQTHEPNAYASNWNLWMPHFMGIYRPLPTSDFMNGFHGFPTRGGSALLWTGDLGHPVTYGCILISSENAAALYAWAEAGVVVEVRP